MCVLWPANKCKPHCMCVCVCVQSESIMHARWPEAGKVDEMLVRSSQYLMDAAHDFRIRRKALMQPKKVTRQPCVE